MKFRPAFSGNLIESRALLGAMLVLLVLSLGARHTQAEAPLTYNFVKFPPFQYLPNQPDGEAQGVNIDLLRLAAAEIDLPLLYQQIPPQRLIKLAEAGQMQLALVSSLFIAPFKPLYLCSQNPISHVRPTLYVNQELHPHIEQAKDLTDEVVYAPHSTSNSLFPLLPSSVVPNSDNRDTIVSSLFRRGRAGLVVNFKENMQLRLDRSPPTFPYLAIELAALEAVLCINKNIENHQAIHRALEHAFLRAAHSTQGQAIFDRHEVYLEFIAAPNDAAED